MGLCTNPLGWLKYALENLQNTLFYLSMLMPALCLLPLSPRNNKTVSKQVHCKMLIIQSPSLEVVCGSTRLPMDSNDKVWVMWPVKWDTSILVVTLPSNECTLFTMNIVSTKSYIQLLRNSNNESGHALYWYFFCHSFTSYWGIYNPMSRWVHVLWIPELLCLAKEMGRLYICDRKR